ncbi:MAG: esterase family protein [Balneolaceae bacterium]
MKREYLTWKSPSLGKEMEMLVFGERGTPVLVFPSEEGQFFEWEDSGIIEQVSEQIDEGYNQFFCVDSVASESFLNKNVDPNLRLSRHSQYESYIVDEVIPRIRSMNKSPYLIATGANMGAYYALLMGLKHPNCVSKVIAISGSYDIAPYLDGNDSTHAYYNNPIAFIPNLNDPAILKQYRELEIRMLSYKNDPNKNATSRMSDILWMKQISHQCYVWNETYANPWECVAPILKEHLY